MEIQDSPRRRRGGDVDGGEGGMSVYSREEAAMVRVIFTHFSTLWGGRNRRVSKRNKWHALKVTFRRHA